MPRGHDNAHQPGYAEIPTFHQLVPLSHTAMQIQPPHLSVDCSSIQPHGRCVVYTWSVTNLPACVSHGRLGIARDPSHAGIVSDDRSNHAHDPHTKQISIQQTSIQPRAHSIITHGQDVPATFSGCARDNATSRHRRPERTTHTHANHCGFTGVAGTCFCQLFFSTRDRGNPVARAFKKPATFGAP